MMEKGFPTSTWAPCIEAARQMGAHGGPVVEAERLGFEAWMLDRGWPIRATWVNGGYRGSTEQAGRICPFAMRTRQLWAAWRDRAALAQQENAASVKPRPSAEDAERLAFEAWVAGHCWSLCAEWIDGRYQGSSEQDSLVCPHASKTRQLWEVWSVRAALGIDIKLQVEPCTSSEKRTARRGYTWR